MEIDLEYEFEQETNKCMWDVDGTYSGSYIDWLESKAKQLLLHGVVVPKGTLCDNLDANNNCKNMCLTRCIDGNKFWK